MAALTPMMQQYVEVKEKYKDCILFYRIGDFYEMFFEDAITASKVLEITLTGKDCGQAERAPMCGVPYHACDVYLNKLIEMDLRWLSVNRWRTRSLPRDLLSVMLSVSSHRVQICPRLSLMRIPTTIS